MLQGFTSFVYHSALYLIVVPVDLLSVFSLLMWSVFILCAICPKVIYRRTVLLSMIWVLTGVIRALFLLILSAVMSWGWNVRRA